MRRALVLITIIALWPLARPVAADEVPARVACLLSHVPDDAHLLVVVPNLDQLVGGLKAFGRTIGLDDLADLSAGDALEEPLGEAAAAVDTAGPVALVLSAERDEPLILIMLSSVEPWTKLAQPTTLGPAQCFELPDRRFGAVLSDKVALVARDKAELEQALKADGKFAQRLAPSVRTLLGRRQVVFWADVRAWQPRLQQGLNFIAQMTYMGMAASGPDADAVIQLYKVMFDEIGKLLSQAETYAAGLRIDGDGVFAEDRATFAADSGIAAHLKGIKRAPRDLLRGLPADVGVAFAGEWETPPGAEGLSERFTRALAAATTQKAPADAATTEAAIQTICAAHRRMTGQNGAMLVNAAGNGLVVAGLYLTADAPALRQDLRAGFNKYPLMRQIWGSLPGTDIRLETETVAGVEADAYHFSLENVGEELGPMIHAIYGEDTTLFMAPTAHGVCYAIGAHAAARQALERMLSNPTPLRADARVGEFFAKMSPDPQVCLLIDAPVALQSVMGMLRTTGVPVPAVDFGSKKLPLLGLTFYLEPEALRTEVWVPAVPLKVIIEEFQELDDRSKEAY